MPNLPFAFIPFLQHATGISGPKTYFQKFFKEWSMFLDMACSIKIFYCVQQCLAHLSLSLGASFYSTELYYAATLLHNCFFLKRGVGLGADFGLRRPSMSVWIGDASLKIEDFNSGTVSSVSTVESLIGVVSPFE